MNFTESQHYYQRAAVIPGRSSTRSKSPGRFFDVGAGPMYALRGEGCRLIDVDSNVYIDTLSSLGAISLGYGEVDATQELLDGQIYSLPSFLEPIAAELVLAHVTPWASHVRFVKTGSEATHAAYRIARRATGRKMVLVASNAYHGWHEWCSFDGEARVSESGTAARYAYGVDWDRVGPEYFAWDDVAAIFVEPARWQNADPNGWLAKTRVLCDRIGALLVFDEMIYGGRWALGGASQYYSVTPDLACFGKALGNGAPIALVAGRDALAEHGELASGTYSGDAAALAALCATVRTYTNAPVIETLWARGRQLRRGLKEAVVVSGVAARVEGMPVHLRLTFEADVVGSQGWGGGWGNDRVHGRMFAAAMARRGVLWHPDCVNVNYAMVEADIDQVVEAAAASLKETDDRS